MTTMPFGSCSFNIVMRLKITMDGGFCPDAVHARTQVKCVLSWPVVFSNTDDAPVLLPVLVRGRSNVKGTSSIFVMSFWSDGVFLYICFNGFLEFFNFFLIVRAGGGVADREWSVP